jgi:hypothetical protein
LNKEFFRMKNRFLVLFLVSITFSQAQESTTVDQKASFKDFTYSQFDLAIPLRGNPDRGEIALDGSKNDSWFLFDGVSAKIGYGVHYNSWIGISLNTGIEWKAYTKFVAVPVFGTLRISPKISDETRITLLTGYGKGFALGRGNLQGNYKKIALGIESDEGYCLFLELSEYGIKLNNIDNVGSISFGLAFFLF